MTPAVFAPRAQFERLRGSRGFACEAAGLWSVGNLAVLARPCVAIVGTRSATPRGRGLARAFARDLAAAGCTVLSGLALGIDTAAHEGALDAGAPTVGVLGGGHVKFFPPRNRALAERIAAGCGAVLSPYPPDEPARAYQFLARNAVVAALADAVLVIEAPARSGALNTAGWAAGRIPVLAVPGDVDRPHVQGCLALIRDGATLARHPDDVLEALGRTRDAAPAVPAAPRRDPLEAALLAFLRAGEATIDALCAASGGAPGDVLAALARLELDGAVECRGLDRFAAR